MTKLALPTLMLSYLLSLTIVSAVSLQKQYKFDAAGHRIYSFSPVNQLQKSAPSSPLKLQDLLLKQSDRSISFDTATGEVSYKGSDTQIAVGQTLSESGLGNLKFTFKSTDGVICFGFVETMKGRAKPENILQDAQSINMLCTNNTRHDLIPILDEETSVGQTFEMIVDPAYYEVHFMNTDGKGYFMGDYIFLENCYLVVYFEKAGSLVVSNGKRRDDSSLPKHSVPKPLPLEPVKTTPSDPEEVSEHAAEVSIEGSEQNTRNEQEESGFSVKTQEVVEDVNSEIIPLESSQNSGSEVISANNETQGSEGSSEVPETSSEVQEHPVNSPVDSEGTNAANRPQNESNSSAPERVEEVFESTEARAVSQTSSFGESYDLQGASESSAELSEGTKARIIPHPEPQEAPENAFSGALQESNSTEEPISSENSTEEINPNQIPQDIAENNNSNLATSEVVYVANNNETENSITSSSQEENENNATKSANSDGIPTELNNSLEASETFTENPLENVVSNESEITSLPNPQEITDTSTEEQSLSPSTDIPTETEIDLSEALIPDNSQEFTERQANDIITYPDVNPESPLSSESEVSFSPAPEEITKEESFSVNLPSETESTPAEFSENAGNNNNSETFEAYSINPSEIAVSNEPEVTSLPNQQEITGINPQEQSLSPSESQSRAPEIESAEDFVVDGAPEITEGPENDIIEYPGALPVIPLSNDTEITFTPNPEEDITEEASSSSSTLNEETEIDSTEAFIPDESPQSTEDNNNTETFEGYSINPSEITVNNESETIPSFSPQGFSISETEEQTPSPSTNPQEETEIGLSESFIPDTSQETTEREASDIIVYPSAYPEGPLSSESEVSSSPAPEEITKEDPYAPSANLQEETEIGSAEALISGEFPQSIDENNNTEALDTYSVNPSEITVTSDSESTSFPNPQGVNTEEQALTPTTNRQEESEIESAEALLSDGSLEMTERQGYDIIAYPEAFPVNPSNTGSEITSSLNLEEATEAESSSPANLSGEFENNSTETFIADEFVESTNTNETTEALDTFAVNPSEIVVSNESEAISSFSPQEVIMGNSEEQSISPSSSLHEDTEIESAEGLIAVDSEKIIEGQGYDIITYPEAFPDNPLNTESEITRSVTPQETTDMNVTEQVHLTTTQEERSEGNIVVADSQDLTGSSETTFTDVYPDESAGFAIEADVIEAYNPLVNAADVSESNASNDSTGSSVQEENLENNDGETTVYLLQLRQNEPALKYKSDACKQRKHVLSARTAPSKARNNEKRNDSDYEIESNSMSFIPLESAFDSYLFHQKVKNSRKAVNNKRVKN